MGRVRRKAGKTRIVIELTAESVTKSQQRIKVVPCCILHHTKMSMEKKGRPRRESTEWGRIS